MSSAFSFTSFFVAIFRLCTILEVMETQLICICSVERSKGQEKALPENVWPYL